VPVLKTKKLTVPLKTISKSKKKKQAKKKLDLDVDA
jgi:hypothetical protein